MTEIELKAHVLDRENVKKNLLSFTQRGQHVRRHDEYYGKAVDDKHKIRIRNEKLFDEKGAIKKELWLVTYKRQKKMTGADGVAIEVNDENECTISDPSTLRAFLLDTDRKLLLEKSKDVEDFISIEPKATLELCTIPSLGDFLEIEILAEDDDETTTKKAHEQLCHLMKKAGIAEEQFEYRYYSELLREKMQQEEEQNV